MIRVYAEIFCWKNVNSFCSAKATHIFSAKNIRILYIESAKTVNEMTLNELVKLMTLWTTGPWYIILLINITWAASWACKQLRPRSKSSKTHNTRDFSTSIYYNIQYLCRQKGRALNRLGGHTCWPGLLLYPEGTLSQGKHTFFVFHNKTSPAYRKPFKDLY